MPQLCHRHITAERQVRMGKTIQIVLLKGQEMKKKERGNVWRLEGEGVQSGGGGIVMNNINDTTEE